MVAPSATISCVICSASFGSSGTLLEALLSAGTPLTAELSAGALLAAGVASGVLLAGVLFAGGVASELAAGGTASELAAGTAGCSGGTVPSVEVDSAGVCSG